MKRTNKKSIRDILALTPMQEGMLFHYLKEPEGDFYFEQLSLELSGEIDLEIFGKAWNFIIESNEMLRTFFRWEKVENPVQIILKKHECKVTVFDLSEKKSSRKKAALEEIKAKDRCEGFDLNQVPFRVILCKITENRYCMIVSNHHILMDGWSTGVILKEFIQAYDMLYKGVQWLEQPVKPLFKEFIKWHRKRDRDKEKKFWQKYLQHLDFQTRLPVKKMKCDPNTPGGDVYDLILDKNLKDKLAVFLKQSRITMAAFFYTAWGLLLRTYCSSEDVVFGTTVSGRSVPRQGIEDIVGLFINTVPMRIQTHPGEKIADLLSQSNQALQIREGYENSSLVDIKEYIGAAANEELFDTVLVIENYPLNNLLKQTNGPLSLDSYSMFEMTHYDCTVCISPGDKIAINFQYRKNVLDRETIILLAHHFVAVVESLINETWKRVSGIDIISAEEKRQILVDFNSTDARFPRNKTIHQSFAEQVDRTPDKAALVGSGQYASGNADKTGKTDRQMIQLTYKELNQKSGQLSYLLKERGIKPDRIVGIMTGPAIEMIIGILGVLKAGGAYLPIDPGYPPERINTLLKDSRARLLLTQGDFERKIEDKYEVLPLENLYLYKNDPAHRVQLEKGNQPNPLAYIIYTSGSTGIPKGVAVEHGSVMNLLAGLHRLYPFPTFDVYLLKTSYLFDVSVTELFGWFLGGGKLALLEKDGEKDLREIVKAIEYFAVTHINFVPSQFNVFVDLLTSRDIERISGLKYIFLAGETLLPELINKFRALNCNILLENLYGPTETTVYASYYSLTRWKQGNSIPIGKPFLNTKLYILSMDGGLQPVGVPGELCITGIAVARGYLNRPELTAERFCLRRPGGRFLKKLPPWTPHKKFLLSGLNGIKKKYPKTLLSHYTFYRSGDLARWFPDGNIEFLGRIDHQVKIRGFRIELGEIENQLLKHAKVKEAVVTARSHGTGEHFLCAYIVANPPGSLEISHLRAYLQEKLPGYMIPAHLVMLGEIPRTATGKIDRKSLPEPVITSTNKYIAPGNEIEEMLVDIWAEVLGVDEQGIGIDDNFFELGGHSLKAVGLIGRIHKAFNMEIPLPALFKIPTIRGLSRYMSKREKSRYQSIQPVEEKEYYMLSSAQKRLFILQRMAGGNTVYNMHKIMLVDGKIEKERFEKVFLQLINRHESLKTSFELIDEEPVQRIHDEVAFAIEYYDLTTVDTEEATKMESDEIGKIGKESPFGQINAFGGGDQLATRNWPRAAALISSFIRSFDLSRAPLLRVGLAEMDSDRYKYLLMVDMHHIISDGFSAGVLVKDFISLYEGRELPGLRIQYKDFSQWQKAKKSGKAAKIQEEYWLDKYQGEIPALNLPADFPRPPIQEFAGDVLRFGLGAPGTINLKALALEEECTLFMILISLFNILLSLLSRQEEIIVGVPVAARKDMELETVIGMFVNTLALRNYPLGKKRFSEFLREVKESTLSAFENQDYPFEDLVDKVPLNRDPDRNPIFDVMLVLQNMEIRELNLPWLRLKPFSYNSGISKFDLVLYCEEAEEDIYFMMEYCTKLFKKESIERYIRYFKKIAVDVLEKPGTRISAVEMITAEEKRQILIDFNKTGIEEPIGKGVNDINELFEAGVERATEHIALVLKGEHVTFRELNERANALARMLRSGGVCGNSLVGIMMDRSLEMVEGISGILKAGGAYMPIDPDCPQERVNYIIKDSSMELVLTRAGMGIGLDSQCKCRVVELSETGLYQEGSCNLNLKRCNRGDDLAYVMYTSGSTGKPKGVMVRRDSVANIIRALSGNYPFCQRDAYLFKTSFLFDVSVSELFGWIIGPGRLAIMEKGAEKDARKILEVIEKEHITHINFVPSMFNVFVEILEGNIEKLSGLRYIFLAGEALLPVLAKRFMLLSSGVLLENIYGPTESTIYASSFSLSGWKEKGNIPIGKPLSNIQLYILDKYDRLQPVGVPGELCISGAGLALGYLNRPGLTGEKFVSSPFLSGERLYLTGDLSRWLSDGNIEFLGRLDQQVKVRGFRIEPGEIENQLLKHEEIREAVVLAMDDEGGDKYLAAYIVPGGIPLPGLREYLLEFLPDYMVPSYFMQLDEVPLTPTGKLDRSALPSPVIGLSEKYTAPGDEVERRLAEIWKEVLLLPAAIGIDNNFFKLGGHSLKAMTLVAKVHKAFNVQLPLAEIFKRPSVRRLSQYIRNAIEEQYISIEAAEKKDYYALSSAQQRLYLLQQMEETGMAYNMPSVWVLEGDIEKTRLADTFSRLIQRHESLRTSFQIVGEEPVQRVHREVEFEIEYHDWQVSGAGDRSRWEEVPSGQINACGEGEREPAATLISSFIRPFDLSRAPLFRVGLIKREENKYILIVDMHHIISDGISCRLLVSEFMALVAGKDFPPLRLRYKDFSQWQNRKAQSDARIKQKTYWKKQLGGEIQVLDMPCDYARPTIQGFEGSRVTFEIGQEEVQILQSLALSEGATLYMILLAIYYILLSKLSNQEDILVGTPTAGRPYEDLQQIIGMFVNTLVMRNSPIGDKTYRGFLKQIKKKSLEAFENQDYPYEALVEELEITRDASRNPLFDIMFAMQNPGIPGIEIPGLKLTPDEHQIETSKFDLTLIGMEVEEGLQLIIEYSTHLFKKATIERFAAYLKKIVSTVVGNPDVSICDVEILSEEEKKEIIYDFNNTTTGYSSDKVIDELFAEQTAKTPDSIAVIWPMLSARCKAPSYRKPIGDTRHCAFSYRKLNKRSHQLACFLKEKGVGPDIIVGIMVERSIEMVVAIMGILKAGGAYLPIGVDYPEDRVRFMLADSNARILLSGESEWNKVKGNKLKGWSEESERTGETEGIEGIEVIGIEDALMPTLEYHHPFQEGYDGVMASVNSLAYVLYTSGSTGRPRGVPVQHGSVVNILLALYKEYPLLKEDTYLLKTTYTFDVSVSELFGWYLGGGRLAILEPGGEKDPLAILDWIERIGVTHINFVPSMFNVFVDLSDRQTIGRLTGLKYIFLAGEPFLPRIAKKFVELKSGIRLENIYGPTEATIYASKYSLSKWDGVSSISIGKPLGNVKLYIIDQYYMLQPVGIVGELCIAGKGLARGYLNNPGITAEKFKKAVISYSSIVISRSSGYSPNSQYLMANDRLYKTGDLARWLPDGNIELLGRIDQQVKIRGFRIELGEIESQLTGHNEIKEAVVLAKLDKNGERYLCAYIVARKELAIPGLREYLSKGLPGFMIPYNFVFLDKISLTPNGKIDRRALPEPDLQALPGYSAPRNRMEEKLVELWIEVLDVEKSSIGIDSNFFDLGGHSLKVNSLLIKIHRDFDVKLSMAEVFKTPCIRQLAEYIKGLTKDQDESGEPVEKKDSPRVSSTEKRLNIIQF